MTGSTKTLSPAALGRWIGGDGTDGLIPPGRVEKLRGTLRDQLWEKLTGTVSRKKNLERGGTMWRSMRLGGCLWKIAREGVIDSRFRDRGAWLSFGVGKMCRAKGKTLPTPFCSGSDPCSRSEDPLRPKALTPFLHLYLHSPRFFLRGKDSSVVPSDLVHSNCVTGTEDAMCTNLHKRMGMSRKKSAHRGKKEKRPSQPDQESPRRPFSSILSRCSCRTAYTRVRYSRRWRVRRKLFRTNCLAFLPISILCCRCFNK